MDILRAQSFYLASTIRRTLHARRHGNLCLDRNTRMKKLATTLGLMALTLSGCASIMPGAPPVGFFYTGVKGVGPSTRAVVTEGQRPGPKQGKACATGVLGLAAWGDMSLDAAKKAGGITRVDTVDYSAMGILGAAYAKNCTIITGE